RKVVDETTLAVLKAKVSGAKDGSLRAALNEKYVGKYSEAKEYKNTLEGLHRTPVIGGFLTLLENSETIKFLIQILNLDPSLAEQAGNIPDVLQNTDSPIPLRSFDYNIFADKILLRLEDVKKMVENRNGAGKPVKIDLQVLLDFHNDVKASVGSRDYQTVGDKLAVGILYNLLSAVCDVIDAYKETPEYKEAESFEGFDANWIMANISDKVDTVMGYIDAIGYIYDCKLDVAGLVGGMID
ncbi:MAG: hypothetical protein IJ863_04540, partial [Spirochaetales bacterium]|nr:hypothetical protein [Spirochaetales bacterium]